VSVKRNVNSMRLLILHKHYLILVFFLGKGSHHYLMAEILKSGASLFIDVERDERVPKNEFCSWLGRFGEVEVSFGARIYADKSYAPEVMSNACVEELVFMLRQRGE